MFEWSKSEHKQKRSKQKREKMWSRKRTERTTEKSENVMNWRASTRAHTEQQEKLRNINQKGRNCNIFIIVCWSIYRLFHFDRRASTRSRETIDNTTTTRTEKIWTECGERRKNLLHFIVQFLGISLFTYTIHNRTIIKSDYVIIFNSFFLLKHIKILTCLHHLFCIRDDRIQRLACAMFVHLWKEIDFVRVRRFTIYNDLPYWPESNNVRPAPLRMCSYSLNE